MDTMDRRRAAATSLAPSSAARNGYNGRRRSARIQRIRQSGTTTAGAAGARRARRDADVPDECAPEVADDEIDDSCVICGNEDSETYDLIVFCDGCDITVCQQCYSIPKVPEGEWRCRPCAAGARDRVAGRDVYCALCTKGGGALEPTMCGRWAHTSCCQAFEEVYFVDLGNGNAAVDLSKLFPGRQEYSCSMCNERGGACIVCPRGVCKAAYHPMCAKERQVSDGLVMYVEEMTNGQPVLRICCQDHSRKLGGKVPTDIRRPQSTRVLPCASRLPAEQWDVPEGNADVSAGKEAEKLYSQPTRPRVVSDPTRHRRKRGRVVGARSFVDPCIQRSNDTAMIFESSAFDRFASRTADVRKRVSSTA